MEGLNIESENVEITSFAGHHLLGKTDLDVEGIHFDKATMFYVPEGIGKIFKNLKKFVVGRNMRFKHIKRSNLKNLVNLDWLEIIENKIENVDMDTVWDIPTLEWFVFGENKIKHVDNKTFEKTTNLISVQLNDNEIEIFDENTLSNLPKLERFYMYNNKLKELHKNTFERNPKLKIVSLFNNKLEILPADLFKTNLLLEIVDFSSNSLKVIQTDFSDVNIGKISFLLNICIDAYYDKDDLNTYSNRYKMLTEFQTLIRTNCLSADT